MRSCCGNLLAQVVPRGAAFQHQHLEVRREAFGLAPPVVQHRGGADDERRLRVLPVPVLEPRQPGQRLQGLAQAHVVGEDAAEPDAGSGGRGNRSRPSDRAASRPAPRRAGRMAGTPSKFLRRSRSALAWAESPKRCKPFLVQMRHLLQPDASAPPAPGHPPPGPPSLRAPIARLRCPVPPSRSRAV